MQQHIRLLHTMQWPIKPYCLTAQDTLRADPTQVMKWPFLLSPATRGAAFHTCIKRSLLLIANDFFNRFLSQIYPFCFLCIIVRPVAKICIMTTVTHKCRTSLLLQLNTHEIHKSLDVKARWIVQFGSIYVFILIIYLKISV